MLSHGDEFGRTQLGNNNAYCQDNELTWIDWDLDDSKLRFLEFVRRVFALRRRGAAGGWRSSKSTWSWISARGWPMTSADWRRQEPAPLGLLIGDAPVLCCLLFNPADEEHLFSLPRTRDLGGWHQVVNTGHNTERQLAGHSIRLAPNSFLLLEWRSR